MNDQDRTVMWSNGIGDDLPERLWADNDFTGVEDTLSVDPRDRLVSLGFIRAALRRRVRLWCITAAVGFVIGCGLFVKFPPAYQASTSVLLKDGPNEDAQTQIMTDVALAQSTTVAANVVHQLGLQQSVGSFLAAYTVTEVSDQVLTITVSAPTSSEALQRASAVAAEYLKVRAEYARTQQQQMEAELGLQVTQARQHLNSINSQISSVSAQPSTPAQQARLASLQVQRDEASAALSQTEQDVTGTLVTTRAATQSMVQDTQVINAAAPLKHSRTKGAILYVAGGLVGGLAIGMVIVIISALVSDRLRRRDDIAYAFGAPVRLSVGPLREGRLPDLRRQAAIRHRHMGLVVEHLRSAVPGSSRGPVGLAVVAVDDPETVAHAVVELAVSSARQRKRVVLADLSAGAYAARLVGAESPGISAVSPDGVEIMVVVPAAEDVAPVGPLSSGTSPAEYGQDDGRLAAACAGADLVLSLVTLDPAFGGEYVATWATDAVAVVTAGRSTAARIHAISEMIRLAGARIDSVVLIGADKTDESLGAGSTVEQQPAPL